jgi:ketosteroid isomerase-like protein
MAQPEDFDEFMRRRAQAALAYVNGDFAPLGGLVPREGEASFFGPGGGSVRGAGAVAARYETDARNFETGSENQLDIIQSGADGDVGFWTGFQNARVRLRGKPEPVAMRLRVTEIFRRGPDGWAMVHRHADMLAEAK